MNFLVLRDVEGETALGCSVETSQSRWFNGIHLQFIFCVADCRGSHLLGTAIVRVALVKGATLSRMEGAMALPPRGANSTECAPACRKNQDTCSWVLSWDPSSTAFSWQEVGGHRPSVVHLSPRSGSWMLLAMSGCMQRRWLLLCLPTWGGCSWAPQNEQINLAIWTLEMTCSEGDNVEWFFLAVILYQTICFLRSRLVGY